jgi:hypothetical protein
MDDISRILANWRFDASKVQARVAEDERGRKVIQLRIDMGVLEMQMEGRPDGERPGGYSSILAQYRALGERIRERAEGGGGPRGDFEIPPEDYAEVDREILQYYHRRLAFYGVGDYARAAQDADHTLQLLELVRKHAKNAEYVERISGMLPSVLLERARTRALVALRKADPGAAVEHIEGGMRRIREHFRDSPSEAGDKTARDLAFLRRWARRIRRAHDLGEPLDEQLEDAVRREDYREAARLRDEIRRRTSG